MQIALKEIKVVFDVCHTQPFVDLLGVSVVEVHIQSQALDIIASFLQDMIVEQGEHSLFAMSWHHIDRVDPVNETTHAQTHLMMNHHHSYYFLVMQCHVVSSTLWSLEEASHSRSDSLWVQGLAFSLHSLHSHK